MRRLLQKRYVWVVEIWEAGWGRELVEVAAGDLEGAHGCDVLSALLLNKSTTAAARLRGEVLRKPPTPVFFHKPAQIKLRHHVHLSKVTTGTAGGRRRLQHGCTCGCLRGNVTTRVPDAGRHSTEYN